ncbi:MAG: hypothetical protein V4592_26310 [Bacteroidota bacterium]
MKKLTLSVLLLAIGASVYAQPPKRPVHSQLPPKLTADLKLTPEQQIKVTSILKAKNIEMDSLAKKAKVGRERMVSAKFRSAESEANDQLYAMFTKDQQLVYAQWILDRRAAMQKRMAEGKPPVRP